MRGASVTGIIPYFLGLHPGRWPRPGCGLRANIEGDGLGGEWRCTGQRDEQHSKGANTHITYPLFHRAAAGARGRASPLLAQRCSRSSISGVDTPPPAESAVARTRTVVALAIPSEVTSASPSAFTQTSRFAPLLV